MVLSAERLILWSSEERVSGLEIHNSKNGLVLLVGVYPDYRTSSRVRIFGFFSLLLLRPQLTGQPKVGDREVESRGEEENVNCALLCEKRFRMAQMLEC